MNLFTTLLMFNERRSGMILARYKGRYFIELKNLTKEELAADIEIISALLKDENALNRDVMLSIDLFDPEER